MKLTIEKYGEFQWWRSWPENSITHEASTEGNLNMAKVINTTIGAKLEEKQMIMSILK